MRRSRSRSQEDIGPRTNSAGPGIDWPLMATVEVQGVEGMRALAGQTIGPSDWRTVTQADIDAFAELSGDDQWIHVDVERAR